MHRKYKKRWKYNARSFNRNVTFPSEHHVSLLTDDVMNHHNTFIICYESSRYYRNYAYFNHTIIDKIISANNNPADSQVGNVDGFRCIVFKGVSSIPGIKHLPDTPSNKVSSVS